jgi:hypothetical protein
VQKYAEKRGEQVRTYRMGDRLEQVLRRTTGRYQPENMLNLHENLRQTALYSAFLEVRQELERRPKEEHALIDSHCLFWWKNQFTIANPVTYIRELKPDLCVTMIEDANVVAERLRQDPKWRQSMPPLEQICSWQNCEVELNRHNARELAAQDFTLYSSYAPRVLYELLQSPRKETAYLSFPMTHMKSDDGRRRIEEFKHELAKYFNVLAPIELKGFSAVLGDQVVRHDLKWLIGSVEHVVAYFPEIVPSHGVVSELKEAHENGKTVWLVTKSNGPFESFFSCRKFPNRNRFFRALEKDYLGERKAGLAPEQYRKLYLPG